MKIFQSYSLGDPYSKDSQGKGKYFSNILGELWWNFSPYLSAKLEGELNPYHWDLEVWNASLNIKDDRGDAAHVQYRYTEGDIKEVNAGIRIKPFTPLYLYGSTRYNLLDHWKVENIYGAEYQSQCWSMGFFVTDKNRSPDGTQKSEWKFSFYVTLLNIGSGGHRSRFMNL